MDEKPTLRTNNTQPAQMHKLIASGLIAVLALAGFTPVQAQNYTVTDLGYPGSAGTNSASEAHGVNQNGSAVGTWWDGSSNKGSQYAFLYSNGSNVDLGTLKKGGAYDYAIAFGINNSKLVVGQGTTSGNA